MIAKSIALATAALLTTSAFAAYSGPSVILNEYNAVGSTKFLKNDKSDTTLGTVLGNGGNWFELTVLGDGTSGSTVDLTGATLAWEEDGTSGSLTLSNNAFWSSLTAGTIITFAEEMTIAHESGSIIVNGSDTTTNFASGDNWAHIYAGDTNLIASSSTDDGGIFSVGNSNWNLTLTTSDNTTLFGPIGEDTGGASGGVNSQEVFKYENSLQIPYDIANYNDGSSSSFGAANTWGSGAFSQDFSAFGVTIPEPASLALLSLGTLAILSRRK
ncbi:hypothetical protein KS4_17830 [Poriferisphaera corsica]|uniref:LTD domain-containing protein n=1 Tax=Poriferisphaera corsica TaxID=2528020 RepID=A0A517YU36_9BACT|nr:PEP-CTERM sorting domain-containing protein [Poriferisphaera corsica]QDU33727.1 hypothetical protein KS4_17830 [Poriferisphaera corsica]